MSRFEAINCDGPGCISNDRMNPDLDYVANWLTVYDVSTDNQETRMHVEELHFCCYSCLARFATTKEQQRQARITVEPEKEPEPRIGLPKFSPKPAR